MSTRSLTESEGDFIFALRDLLNKYQVEIEYDPNNTPVFCDENGVGIFLSIHDIYNKL